MRCLERNKREFYYCLFKQKADILDSGNNKTGEFILTYFEAVKTKGNISSSIGESQLELFGSFTDYGKVIVVDDPNCPIDENSVLFIDVTPTYDTDSVPNYNYIVKKKAVSLNSCTFAISKVK